MGLLCFHFSPSLNVKGVVKIPPTYTEHVGVLTAAEISTNHQANTVQLHYGNPSYLGSGPSVLMQKPTVNGSPVGPLPSTEMKMAFIRRTSEGLWDVGIPYALWARYEKDHPFGRFEKEKRDHPFGHYEKENKSFGLANGTSPDENGVWNKPLYNPRVVTAGLQSPPILLQYWGPNSKLIKTSKPLDIKRFTPALRQTPDGYKHELFVLEKDAKLYVRKVTGSSRPILPMPNTDKDDIARNPPVLTKDELEMGGIVIDELKRSQGQQMRVQKVQTQEPEYQGSGNQPEYVS